VQCSLRAADVCGLNVWAVTLHKFGASKRTVHERVLYGGEAVTVKHVWFLVIHTQPRPVRARHEVVDVLLRGGPLEVEFDLQLPDVESRIGKIVEDVDESTLLA
jgi:hypothetical protein